MHGPEDTGQNGGEAQCRQREALQQNHPERTVVQLRTDPPPPSGLPLVLDFDEQFYFKPEGTRLWLSPHDETASPPCDSAAEEIDVATAIDRFARVVDWRIDRVEHKFGDDAPSGAPASAASGAAK